MSKVADATTDVGDGSWFRVSEEGYDATTKTWAVVSSCVLKQKYSAATDCS